MQRIMMIIAVCALALSLSACGDGGCADVACGYTGACGTVEDWLEACYREGEWRQHCGGWSDEKIQRHFDGCDNTAENTCDWEGTIRIVDYVYDIPNCEFRSH